MPLSFEKLVYIARPMPWLEVNNLLKKFAPRSETRLTLYKNFQLKILINLNRYGYHPINKETYPYFIGYFDVLSVYRPGLRDSVHSISSGVMLDIEQSKGFKLPYYLAPRLEFFVYPAEYEKRWVVLT